MDRPPTRNKPPDMKRWTGRHLTNLIARLKEQGYRVLGPNVRDGAIVYGELESLPVGWGDEQNAGEYRLRRRGDRSRFGYNLGPASWKQFLSPPTEDIFDYRDGELVSCRAEPRKMAFIGVRACELAAIAVQDRVFMGDLPDPGYARRRAELLVVAVNCSQAAATCFCDSTGDGPAVAAGADLVITEVRPADPIYLVEAGSVPGRALLEAIGGDSPSTKELNWAAQAVATARRQMSRRLETAGLAPALLDALEHPHWDDVADRCLACGNCTQVCPTCFCSTAEEKTDPVSRRITHRRRWDSCFTAGHSYIHGGVIHQSVKSRYRQWLTHKLASWEYQFGVSGCTGCGRCIAWCPVGIDLTVETGKLRREP